MRRGINKTRFFSGLTLLEMVISMTIMAILLAVVLPQFRAIQNSWDSEEAGAEVLQNGRVLIDHLHRNLSAAARITAVSDPSEINGYIEFQDNGANAMRYDISAGNYVEFGPVGSLTDLAGPVSQLQFTCYDAHDLDTPTTDVGSMRSVKIETTLTNAAALDTDMTFNTEAYIRTNALPASGTSKLSEPWLEYDTSMGINSALCRIDENHYLCSYAGPGNDGWATVLTVDTGTWAVAKQAPLEYDTSQGLAPALSQIDGTHYLCAYSGPGGDGWATVLAVNTGTWEITNQTPFEYDTSQGLSPALLRIDGTHYICVYTGFGNDGWATVLTVNTGTWEITNQTPFEYDTSQGLAPALSQIDGTHYLCAYSGPGDDGWATVLAVDTGTWTITNQTPFEYDTVTGQTPSLSKIDGTHYLCAYQGDAGKGKAVVLNIDTGDWTITKGTPFEFDSALCQAPDLSKIDGTGFLCAYGGVADQGMAVALHVNAVDFSISKDTPVIVDADQGTTPALCPIDGGHFLCAYTGLGDDSFAGVLEQITLILP